MITLSKVLITSSKDFQRSEIKFPMASDLMSGGELPKLRLLDTRLTGFEQLSLPSSATYKLKVIFPL